MTDNDRFKRVAEHDHGRCVYCNLDGSGDARILQNFTMDHLVPRAVAGSPDSMLNLVLACHGCNRDKGIYDPSDGAGGPKNEEERIRLIEKARLYLVGHAGLQYYRNLCETLRGPK